MNSVPLTDLIKGYVDNRGKTVPTAEDGIPLIATNCIKEVGLYPVFEKIRYVTKETYSNWFRGHPDPFDIILVNKGTPGLVCFVPDPVTFCFAQDMVALKVDEDKIDKFYLFAYMRSKFFKDQVDALVVGTTIPHLKKSDFNRIQIPLPSKKVQNYIGKMYFDITNKTELNNNVNKTLEEMIMSLYKYWFIDFGPFEDNEFEESEFGMFPKGWKVSSLNEIAHLIKNTVNPKGLEIEVPYFGLEHMPRGSIALGEWGSSIDVDSNKFSFEFGDILFGKLRPYFKKVGIAPVSGICSTDIYVLRPKKGEYYAQLLCTVIQDNFIEYCTNTAGGTRMPRSDWKQMQKYTILLPPVETALSFNKIIQPLVSKIIKNVHETISLKQTRDYLLLRLLIGEFELKESVR